MRSEKENGTFFIVPSYLIINYMDVTLGAAAEEVGCVT